MISVNRIGRHAPPPPVFSECSVPVCRMLFLFRTKWKRCTVGVTAALGAAGQPARPLFDQVHCPATKRMFAAGCHVFDVSWGLAVDTMANGDSVTWYQ